MIARFLLIGTLDDDANDDRDGDGDGDDDDGDDDDDNERRGEAVRGEESPPGEESEGMREGGWLEARDPERGFSTTARTRSRMLCGGLAAAVGDLGPKLAVDSDDDDNDDDDVVDVDSEDRSGAEAGWAGSGSRALAAM